LGAAKEPHPFDTVDQTVFIGLNLTLPGMVRHAAQALAGDEKRAAFPPTFIDDTRENFNQKVFKGDHSDIGRGHGKDTSFLSLAPLFYIYEQGRSAGTPFGTLDRSLYEKFSSSIDPHDLTKTDWKWKYLKKVDRGF
jgi:hypothetical protein